MKKKKKNYTTLEVTTLCIYYIILIVYTVLVNFIFTKVDLSLVVSMNTNV